MESIVEELSAKVRAALAGLLPAGAAPPSGNLVTGTENPDFGDYQSNAAMVMAKALRQNPRALAAQLVERFDAAGDCDAPAVAGPGFVNLRLTDAYIAGRLAAVAADARLGLSPAAAPRTVVVDFSGPNLAKEMHVGHLRSTIIGDAVSRVLEFDGHRVLRLNHVGDWGTQFGMLIRHLETTRPEALAKPDAFAVDDLEAFYREAKARFDADPAFAESARQAVVRLQSGDPATLAVWRIFCAESMRHCHEIYGRLDIRLEDRGESFYNDLLPGVVDDLLAAGRATLSQGAVCVFLDGFKTREGEPLPMIVRKSDGGYNYESTDLAAIRHRFGTLGAGKAVYITDARQQQHFAMVFETARLMGWAPEGALQHIGFGTMMGKDGKPFKTRTGGTVKLRELLDEAEERAYPVARELNPDMPEAELRGIARVVGRATVKYADLVHAIQTDYRFDWDQMLSLDGNTAVYLLYNYARTRSVGRKAGLDAETLRPAAFLLADPADRRLAMKLLRTADVWAQVRRDLAPNILLTHLYETAQEYSRFWTACPVLDAGSPALRESRLALCGLTGRTLRWGLSMVGIPVLERM